MTKLRLAAAGVPVHDALAAGSWAARADLGLPGHPRAVILRGTLVRPDSLTARR